MRHVGLLGLGSAAVLISCAAPATDVDPGALRARQEQACAAVVAEHDGMVVDEITATWDRATPEGTTIVVVRGPGSLHTCEIDAELRISEVLHPEH